MIQSIVKDFLLQNIRKCTLQKKKKNRRNICRGKAKEGQTYKAGAL